MYRSLLINVLKTDYNLYSVRFYQGLAYFVTTFIKTTNVQTASLQKFLDPIGLGHIARNP